MNQENFKNKHFLIIKNIIEPKLVNFIYNYFLIKRQVAKTLFEKNYISPYNSDWGVWNDDQVPNTYSHYADIVMETLLLYIQPILEKNTGLKLAPNYSYARIYKTGDILKRHKDRFSCEISTTLNLGGDEWPIFIEKDPKKGGMKDGKYVTGNTKGIKVILKPGDMLIYKGNILEHWRDVFTGNECVQVFLHYNNTKTENSENNLFDTRPHLGLPAKFKGQKL